MKCSLLDVFSATPFRGNGLAVFEPNQTLSDQQMLAYTRELRQFESIFFTRKNEPNHVSARIFTMEGELDFAGHPCLGLAAHLHASKVCDTSENWIIELNSGLIHVTSRPYNSPSHQPKRPGHCDHFHVTMHQGPPQFVNEVPADAKGEILEALNLNSACLAMMPMEVISTGLPYLIVPVVKGIEDARIINDQFESLLAKHGADFVYVLDVLRREGRTWDNQGQIEDIATGSAAGPAAAFLWKHQRRESSKHIILSQGRFMHRPSTIEVHLQVAGTTIEDILVGGDVCQIAKLEFVHDSQHPAP